MCRVAQGEGDARNDRCAEAETVYLEWPRRNYWTSGIDRADKSYWTSTAARGPVCQIIEEAAYRAAFDSDAIDERLASITR
jgi:hypothetical protein